MSKDATTARIHPRLTYAKYAALPGLRASEIVEGRTSMLHMAYAVGGGEKPETPALRWGRLLHAAILEPLVLMRDAAVYDGHKRGKAWDEFKADNSHAEIVTAGEVEQLQAVSDAVRANRDARRLIDGSEHELTATWHDPAYGCGKARLDGLGAVGVVELKSTARIDPFSFSRTAHRLGYHVKMGWYVHGLRKVQGAVPPVWVVSFEQSAPYDVAVYRVSHAVLQAGEDEAVEIATRYHTHALCNSFPGVANGDVLDFELPAWATDGGDWSPVDENKEDGQ